MLAGYLAFVAGFVNSGGFVLVGTFTSHVTGNFGRFGNDLARGDLSAAILAVTLVGAFFGGAFLASIVIESSPFVAVARAYGVALLIEAGLLGAFIAVAGSSTAHHQRVLDAEALLLCVAMGMQNSMVTRLSGAVVRTTHLTGIVTDLGIECARWYRWQRSRHRPTSRDERPHEHLAAPRPQPARALLLLTIVIAFAAGALLGAGLTLRASRWAMLFPVVAILAASAYAFIQRAGGATTTGSVTQRPESTAP